MSRIYKTASATQYVRALCSGSDDEGPLDLTALPVAFAFTSVGALPQDSDWMSGDWVLSSGYRARIKVGPDGDLDLAPTDYAVWVQIITDEETVQLQAGFLTVGEGTS